MDSLQSATGSDSIAYQGAYLSYIYRPPCNRGGGKGGGAPPMRTGNLKAEKLMRLRLKTSLCKVCRVKLSFLTLFNYQFSAKNVRNGYIYPAHPAQAPWENISRCGKRCFLPCTRCTKGEGRQTVYPLSGHGCYSDWLVPSPKGRSDLSSNSSVPKGSLLMSLDGL